jgi:hypothetical protein
MTHRTYRPNCDDVDLRRPLEQHFAKDFNSTKDSRTAENKTHSKTNTWSNSLAQLLDAFGMSEDRTQQALQPQRARLTQSAASGSKNSDHHARYEFRADAPTHHQQQNRKDADISSMQDPLHWTFGEFAFTHSDQGARPSVVD